MFSNCKKCHVSMPISTTIWQDYCSIECQMADNKDKLSTTLTPTIISDKVIDAINDASIIIPKAVGNKSESELKDFIKELITTEQLVSLREFMSEYRNLCNCISMEYTCLGHQLADIFELDDVLPEPTEFTRYNSMWEAMPKVLWKNKGYRAFPKKKEEDDSEDEN